jgi:uncharacterized protein YrrD
MAEADSLDTFKRVAGMQVISLAEGASLGKLDDFQFDLETHEVYGWSIKGAGVFGKTGAVAATRLTLLGRDVAFVAAEADVEWGAARSKVDGRAWATAWKGTPAMSRRGQALGKVEDFVLDPHGNRVTGLLLSGDLFVPLEGKANTGPSALIVVEDSAVVSRAADAGGTDWWNRMKGAVGGGDKAE